MSLEIPHKYCHIRVCVRVQASLSVSQLQEVEQMIQTIIQQNDMVHTQEVPLARANQIAGLRTVDEVI